MPRRQTKNNIKGDPAYGVGRPFDLSWYVIARRAQPDEAIFYPQEIFVIQTLSYEEIASGGMLRAPLLATTYWG